MKPWRFSFAFALTSILSDLRAFFARTGRGILVLLGKVFGPPSGGLPLRVARVTFKRRKFYSFARLARVELSAARSLGTTAKELLREGRPVVARRVARVAYFHWSKARKVFARLSAVA